MIRITYQFISEAIEKLANRMLLDSATGKELRAELIKQGTTTVARMKSSEVELLPEPFHIRAIRETLLDFLRFLMLLQRRYPDDKVEVPKLIIDTFDLDYEEMPFSFRSYGPKHVTVELPELPLRVRTRQPPPLEDVKGKEVKEEDPAEGEKRRERRRADRWDEAQEKAQRDKEKNEKKKKRRSHSDSNPDRTRPPKRTEFEDKNVAGTDKRVRVDSGSRIHGNNLAGYPLLCYACGNSHHIGDRCGNVRSRKIAHFYQQGVPRPTLVSDPRRNLGRIGVARPTVRVAPKTEGGHARGDRRKVTETQGGGLVVAWQPPVRAATRVPSRQTGPKTPPSSHSSTSRHSGEQSKSRPDRSIPISPLMPDEESFDRDRPFRDVGKTKRVVQIIPLPVYAKLPPELPEYIVDTNIDPGDLNSTVHLPMFSAEEMEVLRQRGFLHLSTFYWLQDAKDLCLNPLLPSGARFELGMRHLSPNMIHENLHNYTSWQCWFYRPETQPMAKMDGSEDGERALGIFLLLNFHTLGAVLVAWNPIARCRVYYYYLPHPDAAIDLTDESDSWKLDWQEVEKAEATTKWEEIQQRGREQLQLRMMQPGMRDGLFMGFINQVIHPLYQTPFVAPSDATLHLTRLPRGGRKPPAKEDFLFTQQEKFCFQGHSVSKPTPKETENSHPLNVSAEEGFSVIHVKHQLDQSPYELKLVNGNQLLRLLREHGTAQDNYEMDPIRFFVYWPTRSDAVDFRRQLRPGNVFRLARDVVHSNFCLIDPLDFPLNNYCDQWRIVHWLLAIQRRQQLAWQTVGNGNIQLSTQALPTEEEYANMTHNIITLISDNPSTVNLAAPNQGVSELQMVWNEFLGPIGMADLDGAENSGCAENSGRCGTPPAIETMEALESAVKVMELTETSTATPRTPRRTPWFGRGRRPIREAEVARPGDHSSGADGGEGGTPARGVDRGSRGRGRGAEK